MLKEASALRRNYLVWHVLAVDRKLKVVVDWILEDGEIIVELREHDGDAGGVSNWHVDGGLNTSLSGSDRECVVIKLLRWNDLWSGEHLSDSVKRCISNVETVHVGLQRTDLHSGADKIASTLGDSDLWYAVDTRSGFGEAGNNLSGVADLSKRVTEHSAHVVITDHLNGVSFHHLLVFFNVHWIDHAPDKTAWLNVELKLEIAADDVWIEVERLKSKDVIEWKVNLELDWMWKTVLELRDIDVCTADGWTVNGDVLIERMDVLTSLLFLLWLQGRVSESFTAALVLLVTGGEITAKDLKLVEDLV